MTDKEALQAFARGENLAQPIVNAYGMAVDLSVTDTL